MEKNKTGKYLKYAIGEIILVVIGILIALSINNYSSNNQKRKAEQEYLLSLKTEFEANLGKLNISINESKERIKAIEGLLTLFEIDVRDTVSSQDMNNMLIPVLGGRLIYEPSTGVLDDITSSGNLNLILNKKLRQHLASFESSLELLKIQTNRANAIRTNLKNVFYKNISIRKLLKGKVINSKHKSIFDNVDNKQVFNSIELENYLLDYLLINKSATYDPMALAGLKEEIETILMEIDQELDK